MRMRIDVDISRPLRRFVNMADKGGKWEIRGRVTYERFEVVGDTHLLLQLVWPVGKL